MVGRIVIIAIMAMTAFAVSGSCTAALVWHEDRRTKNRPLAYLLCLIVVVAASVVFGVIVASPEGSSEEIGTVYQLGMSLTKRDELIENIFLVTILPSLLGVRAILGPKRWNVVESTDSLSE